MPHNEPRKDEQRAAQNAAQQESAQQRMRSRRRRALTLTGGVIAVLASAFALALLAVPRKVPDRFDGPFVGPLTAQKVQVNLNDGRSFLVLDLNVLYDAPAASYFDARTKDPVCAAQVRDALVALGSSKSRADVSEPALKPVLMEELRRAVEPLLFPAHIGDTREPQDADPVSGLRPGLSSGVDTFRGAFGEHVLHVDAAAHTLRLDNGPSASFRGGEDDLALSSSDGSLLHVDVTRLRDDYRGEVQVGSRGRVRRVLLDELLIQ